MNTLADCAKHLHAEAKLPTLSIRDTLAHGADPLGNECAIVVGTITGQQVRLHFPSLEALGDFALGVKGVLNQMRQNSRANGSELVAATPATKFSVGHVAGLPGTVMVLDPDTPNESTYVFENQMAVDIGKMLVVEGGKRLRIDEAISSGKKLTMPQRPRIIRPGEQ